LDKLIVIEIVEQPEQLLRMGDMLEKRKTAVFTSPPYVSVFNFGQAIWNRGRTDASYRRR